MATLKDIRRPLNLSVTQASRALNGYPHVNEETRRKRPRSRQAIGVSSEYDGAKACLTAVRHGGLREDARFAARVRWLPAGNLRRRMQLVLHPTMATVMTQRPWSAIPADKGVTVGAMEVSRQQEIASVPVVAVSRGGRPWGQFRIAMAEVEAQ